MRVYILILLSLISLISNFCSSQELPEGMVHPLTDMPASHEDVEVTTYLPDHSDNKLPIGEVVTVHAQIANNGDAALNISMIMGSLNSPQDFNFHLQNFSIKGYGVVVQPGEELTLDYQFILHPALMPEDYQMAHTVFYSDGKLPYSNTFFNQTIESYTTIDENDMLSIIQLIMGIISSMFISFTFYILCIAEKPEERLSNLLDQAKDVVSSIAGSSSSGGVATGKKKVKHS